MALPLRIEIVKRPDGTGVLRCTRADGSVTWQKQAKHAAFFALHDLSHFAVETALGYRNGSFGLLSQGWALEDAAGQGLSRPVPPEASEVERIVGLFDTERASGALWTAADFTAFGPRAFSQEELHRVRSLRAQLFRQWSAITPGEALELSFPSTVAPPA